MSATEEEQISYNIEDYSIQSLFELFNLDRTATYRDVIFAANTLKIRSNEMKNRELLNFIQDAEQVVLKYIANPTQYLNELDDTKEDEPDDVPVLQERRVDESDVGYGLQIARGTGIHGRGILTSAGAGNRAVINRYGIEGQVDGQVDGGGDDDDDDDEDDDDEEEEDAPEENENLETSQDNPGGSVKAVNSTALTAFGYGLQHPAAASAAATSLAGMPVLGQFQTNSVIHAPFTPAPPTNNYRIVTHLGSNTDPVAVGPPIDRTQHVGITTEQHAVIQQRPLPIPQHFQVPIIQGQLNPNHESIVQRVINIDSQFRQSLYDNPADYTLDLSEPLVGVVQLTMTAFEIKHSWYAFDEAYGTTVFYVDNTAITIPAGNYTATDLESTIQSELTSIFPSVSSFYDTTSAKFTFTNAGGADVTITFYDPSGGLVGLENAKENHNLGWLLGFRSYDITVPSGGGTNTGLALVDTYGPRYLVLVLDDFNRNRLNKGLVTISEGKDFFKLPSYYNCDTATGAGLTTAQQFTITQIQAAQAAAQANRYGGVQTSDVFARIPIDKTDNFDTLIINEQVLKDNTRRYFGPVDIKRLHVTLLNDKGQVVNLNGMDYSFSIISTHLYQY
jgi:hypothetical protein